MNITIDSDGVVSASGRGFAAGNGSAPGLDHASGGSGASHGGLGGIGAGSNHSRMAYGDVKVREKLCNKYSYIDI